jgi:thiol-disulfide isomerase/thioredoxin
MQNLPNEIIYQISEYLDHKDLTRFSSTCKEYRDLLSKELEEYKNIAEVVNKTYYHIVRIVMNPEVVYAYYVYNVKDAIQFYKYKYPNHKLLDKYINSIEPVTVILRPKVYDSELGEYRETGESRKMSFDSLLYYVTKEYIDFAKFSNEQYGDELYDMNKVLKRVNRLLNTCKKHGVTKTLNLLKIYTERLEFSSIKVCRVINVFS